MGRQRDDPTVIHSSIALLQERFRQLQKVKEMREERQLLQLSGRVGPATHYDPSKLFLHSELISPPRPPLQGSLPCGSNSQSKQTDCLAIETPILNLWPTDAAIVHTSNNFDDSDVDTSLHL